MSSIFFFPLFIEFKKSVTPFRINCFRAESLFHRLIPSSVHQEFFVRLDYDLLLLIFATCPTVFHLSQAGSDSNSLNYITFLRE